MARKQNNTSDVPPSLPPEDERRRQVTIDPDLVRKARMIAASLGVTLPDYVNNRLRPIIEEELPRILREMGVDGHE